MVSEFKQVVCVGGKTALKPMCASHMDAHAPVQTSSSQHVETALTKAATRFLPTRTAATTALASPTRPAQCQGGLWGGREVHPRESSPTPTLAMRERKITSGTHITLVKTITKTTPPATKSAKAWKFCSENQHNQHVWSKHAPETAVALTSLLGLDLELRRLSSN